MHSLYCAIFLCRAISFTQYGKYIICLISFSKVLDILPAFSFARAIGNRWSIFLGINTLGHIRSKTLRCEILAMRATGTQSKGCHKVTYEDVLFFSFFFFFLHLCHQKYFVLLSLSSFAFGLDLLLNFTTFSNRLVWSSSASSMLILSE